MKFKSMVEVFNKCQEYMVSESIAVCSDKLTVGHEQPHMTDIEKAFYSVPNMEELSTAVFHLLHSGYGRYTKNYTFRYNVNRLADGFEDALQLVHFANFVIEEYESIFDSVQNEIDEKIKVSQGLPNKERASIYRNYNSLQQKLHEDPFSPERLQIILLLESYDNLDSYVEGFIELWTYIEPIYIALSNIKLSHLKDLLSEFDPNKEVPTIEEQKHIVTRPR